ncbi:putative protease YdcP precursor [Clostridium acetireducens DSM 10703]|uniref:Putative protease YdcP n=1 Tax=Clostridium acetireducens DSM 10703 TaxID=1121290 RepID=A0A1E8EXW0_9CLOT|nr:U32 family peptidase [Clostridium acetireducens]OFI05772.1 putative protease YdcP precursor [Clostridium acetireducens DSM 10703]
MFSIKCYNYIIRGGSNFSARAYASNFDEENIIKAVDYCHMYGVKVYVTVNTLIKEKEIKGILVYINFLYKIGVDALIVQDLGLVFLLKNYFPDFEIHASTQMTIHNGEGAKFFNNTGFKRIVLSRELSLREIEYISKDLNIETEIFVHGALCICYSGQCLMSSLIGGRSGNRGRCAQPCRLPYTLVNKYKEEFKGYILSPKDICILENIKDIVATGTVSLKIEGRMKRPEYVAGVVSIYRKALENKIIENKDLKILMQLFNREGFSKAYLYKNAGKDMMAYKFPKNTGIEIGKVNKDLMIVLKENLSVKDGLSNRKSGFTVSNIIKNGNQVKDATIGEKVIIKPVNYKPGEILYKTSDSRLLDDLQNIYINPYDKKINIDLFVKFKKGKNLELETYYDNKKFIKIGKIVEKAINKPLDKNKLIENLSKSGDTSFKFNKIHFVEFNHGFLPISHINQIRRELIDDIKEHIIKKYKRKSNFKELRIQSNNNKNFNLDEIINNSFICVCNKEQLRAAEDTKIKNIVVDMFFKNSDIDESILKGRNLYLKIPNIIKEEFSQVEDFIYSNINNIEGIVTANVGIINKFSDKVKIISDYKINTFNSYALEFWQKTLKNQCVSVELNKKELEQISSNSNISFQYFVYGKIEMMVSEYCPIGSILGGKSGKSNCNNKCINEEFYIKDRIGEEFLINTDKFCRCHIYNSVPVNLISDMKYMKNININSFRLDFIDENYDDVIKILKCFKKANWNGDFKNYTRGHYKRGVE